MLDNITLEAPFKPPSDLFKERQQFVYKNITFERRPQRGSPVPCYEASLKGFLRICMYPTKVRVQNSLHKYLHGNNYCDFPLTDIRNAVDLLNEQTGVNFLEAQVTQLEFGCNIAANSGKIISSLLSFKGKDYLPMHINGKIYGKACDFFDYRIKVYDKTLEVKRNLKIDLGSPLLRVEIVWKRVRGIEKEFGQKPLQVKHLLMPETLNFLKDDLIKKYQNSIRSERLNLHHLSPKDLRILAEMHVPVIREELKHHHNPTYKLDRAKYKRIITDPENCIADETEAALHQKFAELINS